MKINKLIYTAALGLLFAACESVETPMFTDADAFVAFDSKTNNVAENAGGEVKIPVSLVASKSLNVTVNFEISTEAYEKNAAKEGVDYRIKGDKTITFTADGEMTQYIVIEPIDNNKYEGDKYFDIKLSSEDCNLGANYNGVICLKDDDHPLAQAGILGNYVAEAPSLFSNEEGVVYNWNVEIKSDPDDVNGVYFSSLAPETPGATFTQLYGTVSDDMTYITIQAQEAGTYGQYTLKLDFNGESAAIAQRSGTSYTINYAVCYAAYQGGTMAGYISAVGPVVLNKVD